MRSPRLSMRNPPHRRMAQGVMSKKKELIDRLDIDRLDYEEWFRRAVEIGIKQVEAGKLIDHETVMKKWLGKAEKLKKPRPKS